MFLATNPRQVTDGDIEFIC